MLRNYFQVAIRSFLRDKTYTFINLSGLAIGLASVLIKFAYVRYEMSYDRYYPNSERIFRLVSETNKNSSTENSVMQPEPLSYTLKTKFPERKQI
jgi:putative ABC transport system permease protein